MNPELLAYAQSLGIFTKPVKKPETVKKKRGPEKGKALPGRPRTCTHGNTYRKPRKDRPTITYCRRCESDRSKAYYHRDRPEARYYREKIA